MKIQQVWGEKYFRIGNAEGAEIHITFAWGNITHRYQLIRFITHCSVSGYEVCSVSFSDRGFSKREVIDAKVYDEPISISYEAPCLKLAYTSNAR